MALPLMFGTKQVNIWIFSDSFVSFVLWFICYYNITDIMRAVIGWKSVLYESIEHKAELQLSRHLPIV